MTLTLYIATASFPQVILQTHSILFLTSDRSNGFQVLVKLSFLFPHIIQVFES